MDVTEKQIKERRKDGEGRREGGRRKGGRKESRRKPFLIGYIEYISCPNKSKIPKLEVPLASRSL